MATIVKKYQANRKSPFLVVFRINNQRVSRFFETEAERDAFIEKHTFLDDNGMKAMMGLSKQETIDIAVIKSLKKDDVSFRDIWEFWAKHNKAQEMLTVWEACDRYVKDLKEQKRDKNHITRVKRILEQFCEHFENALVEHVSRVELENWVKKLPYSGQTKENYKSIVRTAWSFFERNEFVSKNVAKKLKTEKVIMGEIGILTVDEAEKLLRVNETVDPEICGLMALGLFAGMRTSAIARLDYDEIKFADKQIVTPAHKTKIKKRNIIEKLPDNFWAWMAKTPETAFGWSERKLKKRREMAYRRAGLIVTAEDVKRLAKQGIEAQTKFPPHNAFRHSFASYHVAAFDNFYITAKIMSHTGTEILFQHYIYRRIRL